ncbi:hypothetical protein G7Y79_00079g100310 [Physcia stellaris]|nr:hypothetical protein G7Y79_00079g100310 [Physcia stellaris]
MYLPSISQAFGIPVLLSLALFSTLSTAAIQTNCTTCAPNPIASVYPNNVTGTFNATISVMVVPIDYARSLLPKRLASLILPHAYKRFSIPETHYPLVVENAIEHDIRLQGANFFPDFSSFRLTFPFIDHLSDGFSCFRYIRYIALSELAPLAVGGYGTYGVDIEPASFDPSNAPYQRIDRKQYELAFDVYPGNATAPFHGEPVSAVRSEDRPQDRGFPLAFYRNVTNQPWFGNNNSICDNMRRYWNTSVSQGVNEPRNVKSMIKLGSPFLPKTTLWKGVKGIRATTAFLENNFLPCEQLKGYAGTGEGDSG